MSDVQYLRRARDFLSVLLGSSMHLSIFCLGWGVSVNMREGDHRRLSKKAEQSRLQTHAHTHTHTHTHTHSHTHTHTHTQSTLKHVYMHEHTQDHSSFDNVDDYSVRVKP